MESWKRGRKGAQAGFDRHRDPDRKQKRISSLNLASTRFEMTDLGETSRFRRSDFIVSQHAY